jgi:hypothetical protein
MTPEPDAALRLTSRRGSISCRTILDYATDPPPRAGEVPWRPEAITAQWLESALRTRSTTIEVTDVVVVGGTDGTSSRRMLEAGCRATAAAPVERTRFLAKSTPTMAHRLAFARYAGNEVTFYTQVRPELDLELPTCAYAGIDRSTGRSLVLLDDLTETAGAHFCTWQDTLTREQVLDAMTMLATLHRRHHYTEPAGIAPAIAGVGELEEFYGAAWVRSVEESHDRAMELAAEVVPADVLERRTEIIPGALRALEIHRAPGGTLLHSDVHLGNWYVTRAGRMGLCDWQGLTRGHWSRDLAYSVSTLMTPEQRREWYDEVVDHYLHLLGPAAGGVRRPEADVLVRRHLPNALLMWTATLVHPDWVPNMQPDAMSVDMIRRITAAMSDMAFSDAWEGCAP